MLYDRWAEYYDLIYREMVNYRADCEFLTAVFEKHANGKVLTVLDLGCGTGEHILQLSKMGYQVTGVDLSRNLLSRARKKLGRAGLKQISSCKI